MNGILPRRHQALIVNQEPDDTSQIVDQFRRYQPPTFDGQREPVDAEQWLHKIERIFTHIACGDAHRVLCVVF